MLDQSQWYDLYAYSVMSTDCKFDDVIGIKFVKTHLFWWTHLRFHLQSRCSIQKWELWNQCLSLIHFRCVTDHARFRFQLRLARKTRAKLKKRSSKRAKTICKKRRSPFLHLQAGVVLSILFFFKLHFNFYFSVSWKIIS